MMTEALKLVHFKEGYIFMFSDSSCMKIVGHYGKKGVWIYHTNHTGRYDAYIAYIEDCRISDIAKCRKLAIIHNPVCKDKPVKLIRRFFNMRFFDCNDRVCLAPECMIEFTTIDSKHSKMEPTRMTISKEYVGATMVGEIFEVGLTKTRELRNIAEEAYRDIWNSYHNSLEVQ